MKLLIVTNFKYKCNFLNRMQPSMAYACSNTDSKCKTREIVDLSMTKTVTIYQCTFLKTT